MSKLVVICVFKLTLSAYKALPLMIHTCVLIIPTYLCTVTFCHMYCDLSIKYNLKNNTHGSYMRKYCISSDKRKLTQFFTPSWTIELGVLMRVYNMKMNFFPKGHSTSASKIPFISNLKKAPCASKQDRLVLATRGNSH